MREFFKLAKNARFRRTMRMLFRFVFQYWFFSKQRRFLSKSSVAEKRSRLYSKQAKQFTDTAIDMGGLLIKLGQHVSARIDILPKEYTDELSKLQDSVAPVALTDILPIIEAELGSKVDELFASFDPEAIAAASLGQVHCATMDSGEKVAVKVLRPGIEQIIHIDLKSLQIAIRMLKRMTTIGNYVDTDALYQEFDDTIKDELDFEKEGKHAEMVQANFLENMNINIPQIYWKYSSRKVLTMEFMEGVKINQLEKLDELAIDRKELAKNILEIYLQMIMVDGFFHADPHPGNVLVQADGKIALIDFGMVGRVTESMKKGLVSLAIAIYMKDASSAIDALNQLGFLRRNADLQVFSKNLTLLFEQVMSEKADLSFAVVGDNSEELRDFLYSQPFQLPANTTFLGKAVFTVIGISSALDPEIDLVQEVKPFVEEMMNTDFKGNVFSTILDQGKGFIKGIVPTVRKFSSIVTKMDASDFIVKLSPLQEKKILAGQMQQTNRLVRVIIAGALFVSGIILTMNPDREVLSYILMGLGGLGMLAQLRSRKTSRRDRKVAQMRQINDDMVKKPRFHP